MDSLEDRVESLEKVFLKIDPMLAKLEEIDLSKAHADFCDLRSTVRQLDVLIRGDTQTGEMGLTMIINGSKEFGVEPIRTTLRRISRTYDRLTWLAGILGVSTIGSLIGWALFLLGSKSTP